MNAATYFYAGQSYRDTGVSFWEENFGNVYLLSIIVGIIKFVLLLRLQNFDKKLFQLSCRVLKREIKGMGVDQPINMFTVLGKAKTKERNSGIWLSTRGVRDGSTN
jgi:hypothetical protein